MVDDISDIESFYGDDPGREDGRLSVHQLERELTLRFLDRHLPPSGSVLEIGAGTGRYSIELAKRGYAVTAVDLSAQVVEEAKRRVAEQGFEGRVRFVVADARDLGQVPDEPFDAGLMMGPLYHLVEESDRRSALREAHRHLREGAPIFSAFLGRLGVVSALLKKVPVWIEDNIQVRSFLDHGRRPANASLEGFRGYFAQVSEIAPLHEEVGFDTVALVGVEPGIAADDESFNRLEGERRGRWLDLLQEIADEPSIVGASRHLLYIGRKSLRA